MPNMVSRQMDYTDDFGNEFTVRFRIKEEFADQFNEYEEPEERACGGGGSGNFDHRYLLATKDDGQKIRFPVPQREQIRTFADDLLGDDFVCIDLVGESYNVFPGIGNRGASYTIPDGFSNKKNGVIEYTSDVLQVISAKVAFEEAPTAISGVVEQCIGGLQIDTDDVRVACATTLRGFRTRRIIGKAANSNGGTIVRAAPVSDLDPTSCRTAMGGVAVCVGYEGEAIKNLQLYLQNL